MDFKKTIETVGELIKVLEKYPKDTEVCHLTGDRNTAKEIKNLFIYETHPIGSRDMEDELRIAFSGDPEPDKI